MTVVVNHIRGPEVINTTSSSSVLWSRGLSPFYLGPVELYDDMTAMNVENGWQFSKVYREHTCDGEPTGRYWRWASNGWDSTYAHRYPMGKGAIPLYSLWDGRKLDYIQARMEIYIPLYAKAVYKSDAFFRLKQSYQIATAEGRDLRLFDYDSYDFRGCGLTWKDVILCKVRKMGHGFVLGMLLEHGIDGLFSLIEQLKTEYHPDIP